MSIQYRVEIFDDAALDDLGPQHGNEMEQRLNELAEGAWRVVTLTRDADGYVVVLQRNHTPRKRTPNVKLQRGNG